MKKTMPKNNISIETITELSTSEMSRIQGGLSLEYITYRGEIEQYSVQSFMASRPLGHRICEFNHPTLKTILRDQISMK